MRVTKPSKPAAKTKTAPLDDAISVELGEKLRAARARGGMTRRQLAKASDASERYLAHLEAGAGNPSLSVLLTLAQALGLSPADLMPHGGERDADAGKLMAAIRKLPSERLRQLEDWLARKRETLGAKAERVVLIGLRGAGKSSLGSAVAQRLDVPFFEISKEVEQAYGGNIGLLIELRGQNALRKFESEAWERIVARHERAVIAAPGGIVADGPLYSRVLETAHSIWLEAKPADHMQRVMTQGDFRPMANNRAAMDDLRAILEARGADYARADMRLDTSGQDFEQTLSLLEARIRSLFYGA